MKNIRLIGFGVVIVIAVLVSIFTVSSDEVGNWNDKVIDIQLQFSTEWQVFEPSFTPWFDGKKIEDGKIDGAFATYEKDIKQTAGELKRATPPDDETCKAFHAAIMDYADIQVTHLADYRKLVDAMKATNPGTEEEIDKVATAMEALADKESILFDVIGAKQNVMASEHGLRLE